MATIVTNAEAKERLTALAKLVEQGETVVVTDNGKPIFDLVRHRERGGLRLEAGKQYLRERGVEEIFPYVAEDFDEPLPEDFLLRRFPE
jgi:antitoxin (DNA-binding transcriptional repressor) of toxin-antitoxin stability system